MKATQTLNTVTCESEVRVKNLPNSNDVVYTICISRLGWLKLPKALGVLTRGLSTKMPVDPTYAESTLITQAQKYSNRTTSKVVNCDEYTMEEVITIKGTTGEHNIHVYSTPNSWTVVAPHKVYNIHVYLNADNVLSGYVDVSLDDTPDGLPVKERHEFQIQ